MLVEKCLGRRICKKCGKNYNVADIYLKASDDGRPEIIMPPLNPPPECLVRCKSGGGLVVVVVGCRSGDQGVAKLWMGPAIVKPLLNPPQECLVCWLQGRSLAGAGRR